MRQIRLICQILLLTVTCGLIAVSGVGVPAPKPAFASLPFFLTWNPFGREEKVFEGIATASLRQQLRGRTFFTWDSPMSVYPETVDNGEKVIIGASYGTLMEHAVDGILWTDDPSLGPEDADRWNLATEKMGGEHVFRYKQSLTLNVVKILFNIPKMKEVTYRPLPFAKWGKRKKQVRGMKIHFHCRDIRGRDGKWDPLYCVNGELDECLLDQALYKEGMPGRPTKLNWRNERPRSDAENGALHQVTHQMAVPQTTPATNGDSRRWAIPISVRTERPFEVYLDWLNGDHSGVVVADGKAKICIPEGVTGFNAYFRCQGEERWIRNYPLGADGRTVDQPYPVPRKPGGTIDFDVQILSGNGQGGK